MCNIAFESSLPIEEIEKNFTGISVYFGIMESLKEILSHKEAMKAMKAASRIADENGLSDTTLDEINAEIAKAMRVSKNNYRECGGTADQNMFLLDAFAKLAAAEKQVRDGAVLDVEENLRLLRKKHDV